VTVPKGFVLPSNNKTLEEDVHGCPVGFSLTSFQQLISFFCFWPCLPCFTTALTESHQKKITTTTEVVSICMFDSVSAMNIALNNFSLNLIIQSCLPLTTFLSQQTLVLFKLYPFKPCKPLEISLTVCGVLCAGVFTTAKIMGSSSSHHSGSNQVLGVVMCICLLLCGSVNLALAGVLGEMKMSVYDTVAYMSLPALTFLIPFCLIPKLVIGA